MTAIDLTSTCALTQCARRWPNEVVRATPAVAEGFSPTTVTTTHVAGAFQHWHCVGGGPRGASAAIPRLRPLCVSVAGSGHDRDRNTRRRTPSEPKITSSCHGALTVHAISYETRQRIPRTGMPC